MEISLPEREIILTADGSQSVLERGRIPQHSWVGAVSESRHVFIDSGLRKAMEIHGRQLHILEAGFGTGLNALLSRQFAERKPLEINYTALELYPLQKTLHEQLNYCLYLGDESLLPGFRKMHACSTGEVCHISRNFSLLKCESDIATYRKEGFYHLIYYDAFAPTSQPELWTEPVFSNMYASLQQHGILVTYCARSSVRRAMQAAGFLVERIPGPPRKREMLRAVKL